MNIQRQRRWRGYSYCFCDTALRRSPPPLGLPLFGVIIVRLSCKYSSNGALIGWSDCFIMTTWGCQAPECQFAVGRGSICELGWENWYLCIYFTGTEIDTYEGRCRWMWKYCKRWVIAGKVERMFELLAVLVFRKLAGNTYNLWLSMKIRSLECGRWKWVIIL